MERIRLAGGGWAEIRSVEEISERVRRPLMKSSTTIAEGPIGARLTIQKLTLTGAEASEELKERAAGAADSLDVLTGFNDSVILAFVAEWSYGEVTGDTLLDIPAKAYDELLDATPGMDELMPDFSVSPEEDSPTTPSSA